MMKDLRDGLNDAQREAVDHKEGPLLIFAGAGSGKTRVLTHRIASLIGERGVHPGQVLAVTFTVKAANEMKERIARLIGEQAVKELWIGTFHALCSKMLRLDGKAIGVNPKFTIYDEDQRWRTMRDVLKGLPADDLPSAYRNIVNGEIRNIINNDDVRDIVQAVSKGKEKLLGPVGYARDTDGTMNTVIQLARIAYPVYQERLRNNNALDFDDLLMQGVKLLDTQPDVCRKYARRFQHILVDEYQDVNEAQAQWLAFLASFHRNLCVVGDDLQAIYGWRGAEVHIILDFPKTYPDAKVVRLERNYRSTKNILDAAHGVAMGVQQRADKRLYTDLGPGDPVEIHSATDDHEEALYVVDRILKDHENGGAWKDHAILYRTNAQSRVPEELLARAKVPYRIYGGQRFLDRAEIKDVLAYLTLVVNPHEAASLKRVINKPRRGVGEVTLQQLEDYATAEGCSVYDACRNVVKAWRGGTRLLPSLNANTLDGIARFVQCLWEPIQRHQEEAKTPLKELVSSIIEATNISVMFRGDSEEAISKRENIEAFIEMAGDAEKEDPEITLDKFLEGIKLSQAEDDGKSRDAVLLMTIHASKGLEFKNVFVIGCEDGRFPHSQSIYDPERLDEERRLCYVAITRAERRCVLSWSLTRDNGNRTCSPSRFLAEIPEDCQLTEEARLAKAAEEERRSEEERAEAERKAERKESRAEKEAEALEQRAKRKGGEPKKRRTKKKAQEEICPEASTPQGHVVSVGEGEENPFLDVLFDDKAAATVPATGHPAKGGFLSRY